MGYKGKQRRGARAAVATALLLAGLVPLPASAEPVYDALSPSATYPWWGPTDATGWHFRWPVVVLPRLPDPLTKYGVTEDWGTLGGLPATPVQLEIDFSQIVRDSNRDNRSGWPMDEFGRLSSFTFDPASIRVVAYDRASGSIDTSQGREGLVPHAFTATLFENAAGRNPVYNATNNAVGTLQWIVPAPFREPKLYFVYFDTLENGRKPAVTWSEPELGPLRGTHFVRVGTDFQGYLPAVQGTPKARVYVYALYANTTVAMYRYRYAGFDPQEIPPCARKDATSLCLAGGALKEERTVLDSSIFGGWGARAVATTDREPVNEPFFFKVVASKPVVAMIGPAPIAGRDAPSEFQTDFWVPSSDGGLAGSSFVVPIHNRPHAFGAGSQLNGLVLVATEKDASVNGYYRCPGDPSTTSLATIQIKARSSARYPPPCSQGGIVVFNTNRDTPILVGSLPWYTHHGNQAVSLAGAPVGTTLVTAPTRSNGLSIVPHEATAVTFFNMEDPSKVFPPDGPYSMQAGPQNAWIPNSAAFGSHDASPWQIRSTGLASAFAGDRGLDPIGGLDARDFQFVLRADTTPLYRSEPRAFVMPLYPQTRVEIERWDPLRERWTSIVQKLASPETSVVTKTGTAQPIMHGNASDPGVYRVRTSKPAAVYALAEERADQEGSGVFPYTTFLVGRFRSPVTVPGDVEFYGPLVSWKEKLRQETVKPGQQVVFSLVVQNLGRAADGSPLVDSVTIGTRTGKDAPQWTTRLSTAFEGQVPGGGSREVTVVVDVPNDARTDETLDLEVVATSETNPSIRDAALLQITVQTRYEIEAVFKSNNRPTLQGIVDSGQTREFAIRVKNVGSGADGAVFTMLRQNPFGFQADLVIVHPDGTRESLLDPQGLSRIGIDGRPVSVPLEVNEEKEVLLVVEAPRTSDPAQHNFVVEATSASDSASRKQLTLVALTNARTALRIQALNDTFEVAPGRNATLPVEVLNEGVETAVGMTLRAADLPGWNITLDPVNFELRSPGVVDPRDGTPLDRRIVNLTVRAGDGSPVGFIMPIEVTATSGTRFGDAEAPAAKVLVTATVVNNFTLLVPDLLERSVLPGDAVEFDLSLRSLANGNFTVEPVAARLPPGWRLEVPGARAFPLAPGEERTVKLTLHTRPNEAAGLYDGEFGFVMQDPSGDRAVVTAPFGLRVKRHVDYSATVDGAPLVSPGGTTRVAFLVENVGNAWANITLATESPAGWAAELVNRTQAVVTLAPGERAPVDVQVTAPERPVEDVAIFELHGVIVGERDRRTAFNVTVLRDDLAIVRAEALSGRFRTGDPAVFQVTLLNNGTVPRANVELALLVDDRVARNVTVRNLPPGEARTVQIPWNVVPASRVAFLVDPDDRYKEENEANNHATFDLAAARREAPAGGLAGLLAALAAALAAAAFAPAARRERR